MERSLLEGGVECVWELFADDREMKINKREGRGGGVVDPLKAVHSQGTLPLIFSPDVRTE